MSDAPSEDEVWAEVVSRTALNISPILRPTYLPAGLDTVSLLSPSEAGSFFRVEYFGRDKTLRVEVNKYNLPLPATAAHQDSVSIRDLACDSGGKGTSCFLQFEDPAEPSKRMWLAWSEPGRWQLPSQPQKPAQNTPMPDLPGLTQDHVEYLLSAVGLTEQELLAVAEGLRLATPRS
jgi:hypothetical protein